MRDDFPEPAETITIRPERALVGLLLIVGLLLAGHLSAQLYRGLSGDDFGLGLVPFLDVNEEHNAPTLFSSTILLIAAALFAIAATLHRRRGERWLAWATLVALFVFLAIDETATIHEHLIEPFRELFNARGALFYAWVIPYGAATLALAMLYLPFVLRLPPRTRTLLLLAASLYVGGALGMELVAGLFATPGGYGSSRPLFLVVAAVEETLEMLGVCALIYTLADYLARAFPSASLRLARRAPTR